MKILLCDSDTVDDSSVHDSQDDVKISFAPTSNVIFYVDINLRKISRLILIQFSKLNQHTSLTRKKKYPSLSDASLYAIPIPTPSLSILYSWNQKLKRNTVHFCKQTLAYPVSLFMRVDPDSCKYFSTLPRMSLMSKGAPGKKDNDEDCLKVN